MPTPKNHAMATRDDASILISDDFDDQEYLPPGSNRTSPKKGARLKQSATTPRKRRLKLGDVSPSSKFHSFMAPAQATASSPRVNQLQITHFFESPTLKHSRQPLTASPLKLPRPLASFSDNPQIVFPESVDNNEPIAPAPSPFRYRSPSTTLRLDPSEVGYTLSSTNPTAESAAAKYPKSSAAGSTYTTKHPTGGSTFEVAAMDVALRFRAVRTPHSPIQCLSSGGVMPLATSSSGERTPAEGGPSAVIGTHISSVKGHSLIPPSMHSELGNPLRFRAKGQKLPRNVVPAPLEPMAAQPAFNFNLGFKAPKPHRSKPVEFKQDDRSRRDSASRRSSTSRGSGTSDPRPQRDPRPQTQPSPFQKTSCESCKRTFPATPTAAAPSNPVLRHLCSACDKQTAMNHRQTQATAVKRKRSPSPEPSAAAEQELSELLGKENEAGCSMNGQAGPSSTGARTGVEAPSLRRLYTPTSMTQCGGYGLKPVVDILKTPEDVVRRRNACTRKAQYRKKKAEHGTEKETLAASPEAITPATPKLPTKRRRIATESRLVCERHGDPGCTEESCADTFFEPYDPYSQVIEGITPSQSRRAPTPKKVAPVPLNTAEIQEAIRRDMELSLVTRTRPERRPYLGLSTNRIMRVGGWSGSRVEEITLHVDFTKNEAELVRSLMARDQNPLPGMDVFQEIGYRAHMSSWRDHLGPAAQHLPGRKEEDVYKFIRDRHQAAELGLPFQSDDFTIHVSRPAPSHTLGSSSLRLLREMGSGFFGFNSGREQTRAMESMIRDGMSPWRVFKEGSSDVVDISWSPDGSRLALCCCTLNDEYNRPGNLMLGLLEQDQIRMLDGHKVLRIPPVAALNPYLHSTVSTIAHSRDGQLLFSGSYDRTVKVWLGEDGTFVNSLDLQSEVLRLATNPLHDGALAAGLKNGDVKIFDLDVDGNCRGEHLFAPLKKNLEAVAVNWHGQVKPDWFIVGYDNKLENKTGDLVIFDARAMKTVWSVVPGSTRQFDIFIHEIGGQFITAGAANGRGKSVKTQVRVWDFDNGSGGRPCPVIAFDNPQDDINVVTMSPCRSYVTSSGTDGSTIVWDRRFPDRVLHKLKHGKPLVAEAADDAGTNCALWAVSSDRFYTGGSDGVVKIWDVRRGDPFINDFATLDGQVMSAAFSPSFDSLMVGACSGSATLFSTRGDRGVPPDAFKVDIRDVEGRGDAHAGGGGNGDEAARTARELVRSGRMMIRDGVAYATD